jgi:uncharacterized repeat protein (TIGR01451 family)
MTKSRDESIIPGSPDTGKDIHYKIDYVNTGDVPTRGTYIIDAIPDKTLFKKAYTSGTDATVTTFTCSDCQVYFSDNTTDLPVSPSPVQPMSQADITSYFTLGTEVSAGEWDSPFGDNTKWVAWLIDDQSLTNPQLPTGTAGTGTVGLTLMNDDDGV